MSVPCRCGHSKASHVIEAHPATTCAAAWCHCHEYRPESKAEQAAYEAAMIVAKAEEK